MPGYEFLSWGFRILETMDHTFRHSASSVQSFNVKGCELYCLELCSSKKKFLSVTLATDGDNIQAHKVLHLKLLKWCLRKFADSINLAFASSKILALGSM